MGLQFSEYKWKNKCLDSKFIVLGRPDKEEGLETIKGEWYKVAGKVARCAAALYYELLMRKFDLGF